MTKKERKDAQLQRHYKALHNLLLACGINKPVQLARNVSSRLLSIERIAHKAAEDYCNGEIDCEQFDRICEIQESNVQRIFAGKLQGFFINGDARGYALKIKDSVMREQYREIGLQTDWGGYGLLAPEIDGE